MGNIKYSFLHQHNFVLHEDLYFEGQYKDFFIRVIPDQEWIQKKRGPGKFIEYIVIESYYKFLSDTYGVEDEYNLSGEYNIGKVHFENHCAGFIPKDWDNPNFEENFDGLIGLFKRENLAPISKEEFAVYRNQLAVNH